MKSNSTVTASRFHIANGEVKVFTRRGNDGTKRFRKAARRWQLGCEFVKPSRAAFARLYHWHPLLVGNRVPGRRNPMEYISSRTGWRALLDPRTAEGCGAAPLSTG